MSPERVDVAVVGAGHAGLAASRVLSERSIPHVVLERGVVGHAWRHERWDSLRLLTPNWLTRLPGQPYAGDDPDGYMTAAEVADLLVAYAARIGAPVRERTAVTCLRADGDGYRLTTEDRRGSTGGGEILARAVVLAGGAFARPALPAVAASIPATVRQVGALGYRNPDELPEGRVLVVGASATGVQLAAELVRSGRPVTLAVGEHVRMPRLYRGRDVLWWMDATGVWDERAHELDDLTRARRLPSPQLAGTPARSTLDLNALTDAGVELVGRLAAVRDGRALFSGGLRNVCTLADLKQTRLLDGFDAWAAATGAAVDAPSGRPAPTRVPASPRWQIDLAAGEVRTILWATGLRPDYDWLDPGLDVLDAKGRLRHVDGVAARPGLYALGLPVLRRRRSTFIHGAEDDARAVVAHLAGRLAAVAA